MNRNWAALGLTVALIASGHRATAAEKDSDPLWVLMIGAGGEWPTHGNFLSGPAPSVEFNVIKDWLEIELEVSPVFGAGRTDWDTEFIFKKPFELSDKIEVMPGIGPAWLYKTSNGQNTSSFGAVALVDVQIWPSPERNYGWFIEPSYTYDFGREHEQSLGVTFGLLIPIR